MFTAITLTPAFDCEWEGDNPTGKDPNIRKGRFGHDHRSTEKSDRRGGPAQEVEAVAHRDSWPNSIM